ENLYGYLRLTTWMAGTSPAMTASIDSILSLRRFSRGATRPGSRTAALSLPNSNLEFDTDFHDLRVRDLEIGAGPLGVVMHERKQRLAPSNHPFAPPRRDDRLVT